MRSFNDHLELIKLVNDNYNHISQLDTLEHMYEHLSPNVWVNAEEIEKLEIICKTTHNSHYDYKLFTHEIYQNPDRHVDKQLGKSNLTIAFGKIKDIHWMSEGDDQNG